LQILGNIEEIAAPYSVGGVVAAIATQLRLRKLAGGDESKATLAEVNLTLREHNERFRRELEEACSIQKGLLPEKLPSDSRFELAASYQPLEEVGGDWYFAAQDETGALTLSISDVSGHGLSAAFISSMTKLATSAAYDPSIALQLQKTASLLGPQLPAGRFVTMAMCRYFPDSGRLQWARAGHPPAVVVRRNGETTQLQGDGFPVGFVDDATFEQLEEVLEPGDMVLMVTDGITEVQNRAMQVFGVDSLVQVLLSSGSNASAAQVLHNVVDAIDTFREGRVLKDDVTLLLLKRIS
jgi:sigma-B regulation protein RsbU (phosphoserine phosphatase)